MPPKIDTSQYVIKRSAGTNGELKMPKVVRTSGILSQGDFFELSASKDEKYFVGRLRDDWKFSVGDGYINIAGGRPVVFWSNERLQSFYPRTDTTIDKTECSKMREVELHEDGKLKYCTLAVETNINGVDLREGTKVSYDADGNLRFAWIDKEVVIDDTAYPPDSFVFFYPSGELEKIRLADTYVLGRNGAGIPGLTTLDVQGKEVVVDTGWFYFYKSGQVLSVLLSKKYVAAGVEWPEGSRLSFYESGSVRKVALPGDPLNDTDLVLVREDGKSERLHAKRLEMGKVAFPQIDQNSIIIGGVKLLPYGEIELYSDGRLKSGRIAQTMAHDGVEYPAGSLLNFTLEGKVSTASKISVKVAKK